MSGLNKDDWQRKQRERLASADALEQWWKCYRKGPASERKVHEKVFMKGITPGDRRQWVASFDAILKKDIGETDKVARMGDLVRNFAKELRSR